MTSSLEGEEGVGQKMTCDDMMTQGEGGDKGRHPKKMLLFFGFCPNYLPLVVWVDKASKVFF